MDLGEAITILRSSIRDGESSDAFSYVDCQIAIQAAGNTFVRIAKPLKTVSTVLLQANSEDADLTTPLAAGFTPERVLAVYIPGQEETLQIMDIVNVEAMKALNNETGNPQFFAFKDATHAIVFPVPTEAVELKMVWHKPFPEWEISDEADDTLQMLLPRELMINVITQGAAAYAKASSPEDAYKSAEWAKFIQWCRQNTGAGALTPVRSFMIEPFSPSQRKTLRRLDRIYEV